MINPIQITTDDAKESRCDSTVVVVNNGAGPRYITINYEAWCFAEVQRLADKGIESVVKYKERGGARCCSVWRDGRGCYRWKKNELEARADAPPSATDGEWDDGLLTTPAECCDDCEADNNWEDQ